MKSVWQDCAAISHAIGVTELADLMIPPARPFRSRRQIAEILQREPRSVAGTRDKIQTANLGNGRS